MRACPTSYSARASSGVGSAPAPSPPGPEPMSPSPEELREAEEAAEEVEREFLASKEEAKAPEAPQAEPPAPPVEVDDMSVVEEDLHLSSDPDSEGVDLSDVELPEIGKSASEPAPKNPPSGEGWFDMCEGEEHTLKRSASGDVSDPGDQHSGAPIPSPRKMSKPDT